MDILSEQTDPFIWFIGPHPDDNVLSWGKSMSRLAGRNTPVISTCVFGEDPDPSILSDQAQQWHRRTGMQLMNSRWAEDQRAHDELHPDISQERWGYLDIIYRWEGSTPRVEHRQDKYGDLRVSDYALVDDLTHKITKRLDIEAGAIAAVCTIAGLAPHIDHKIVSLAVRRAVEKSRSRVALYLAEDMPYALQSDGADLCSVALPGDALASSCHTGGVQRRHLKAIEQFTTQVPTFDEHLDNWRLRIEEHARNVGRSGFGERFLVVNPPAFPEDLIPIQIDDWM